MPSTPSFRLVAMIIASAMFMEQLDGTILATALPQMARSFAVSPLHMSVALTSYMLSLAVFIPASGVIADRYGSRRVFMAAIVLFTLGSVLCGQAGSLVTLVMARLVQGIGGAMMVPVGRLVLLRTVSKAELVSALSWVLVPALIGPVLGPPLGGLIVTYLSWRWIFYVNVPVGLLGLWLAAHYIADVREELRQPFDGFGMVLSGAALSCLVFGFEMSSRGAVSRGVAVGILGTGAVLWWVYVRHARRLAYPILDLTLLRFDTFRLSVYAGSLTRISAGAMPFLLPLLMQLGFGMSAARSGMITFVSAAGALLMKAIAKPILRQFGFRNVLLNNGVIGVLFIGVCALFAPTWPLWIIYMVLALSGLFQSLQFTAYNAMAYAEVPTERLGAATAFYSTFQQLMLSVGICVSAAALHLSVGLHGRVHAAVIDFSLAFITVASISLLAVPLCTRLQRDAGADISGHSFRRRRTEDGGRRSNQ